MSSIPREFYYCCTLVVQISHDNKVNLIRETSREYQYRALMRADELYAVMNPDHVAEHPGGISGFNRVKDQIKKLVFFHETHKYPWVKVTNHVRHFPYILHHASKDLWDEKTTCDDEWFVTIHHDGVIVLDALTEEGKRRAIHHAIEKLHAYLVGGYVHDPLEGVLYPIPASMAVSIAKRLTALEIPNRENYHPLERDNTPR